jgi:hypothetical protein
VSRPGQPDRASRGGLPRLAAGRPADGSAGPGQSRRASRSSMAAPREGTRAWLSTRRRHRRAAGTGVGHRARRKERFGHDAVRRPGAVRGAVRRRHCPAHTGCSMALGPEPPSFDTSAVPRGVAVFSDEGLVPRGRTRCRRRAARRLDELASLGITAADAPTLGELDVAPEAPPRHTCASNSGRAHAMLSSVVDDPRRSRNRDRARRAAFMAPPTPSEQRESRTSEGPGAPATGRGDPAVSTRWSCLALDVPPARCEASTTGQEGT